jgi:hypothetical protein
MLAQVVLAESVLSPEGVAMRHLQGYLITYRSFHNGQLPTGWDDLEEDGTLERLNRALGADMRDRYMFLPDDGSLTNKDGREIVMISIDPTLTPSGSKPGRVAVLSGTNSIPELLWLREDEIQELAIDSEIDLEALSNTVRSERGIPAPPPEGRRILLPSGDQEQDAADAIDSDSENADKRSVLNEQLPTDQSKTHGVKGPEEAASNEESRSHLIRACIGVGLVAAIFCVVALRTLRMRRPA